MHRRSKIDSAKQAELEKVKDGVAADITAQEERRTIALEQRDRFLGHLGNGVHPSVPVFKDEEHNRVEREVGGKPSPADVYAGDDVPLSPLNGQPSPRPLHHHELLHMIGGYEAEAGSKAAGHRGYYLTGPGFKLSMAAV